MHQLTYTSCRPGMSLNGSGGYTVRAASTRINQAWIASAPQLARYDVASISSAPAVVRLAFRRRQNGSVITHSAGVRDHESRSASFTHAIIDPTGKLGPVEAIGMWRSPFWRLADDDGPADLPPVETLPANGALDWPTAHHRLQDDRFNTMVQFLLSSWLRRMDCAIVLLAEAESVATAVWLLTRCLPAAALSELSFASHDHDPTTAGLTIVGYGDVAKSLPRQMLAARHWFDARTGDRSGRGIEPYAEFACREILAGRWRTVEAFRERCEELHVDCADDIDLLYRIMHESHVCTEQELLRIQHRPQLLRCLLRDQRHHDLVLSILTEGRAGASSTGESLIVAVCDSPERARTFVSDLLQRAGRALVEQDLKHAAYLIGLCEGVEGAPTPLVVWLRAVEQIGIDRLTVETRLNIVGVLDRLGVRADTDGTCAHRSLVTRLLDIPAEELPATLRCAVDTAIKVEVCRMVLDNASSITPTIVKALLGQRDVLALLLRRAANATAIAGAIAESEPVAILDILVTDNDARRRIDVDVVVDRALAAGKLDCAQLATLDFARYWGLFLKGRYADQVVGAMLQLSVTKFTGQDAARRMRGAFQSASVSESVAVAFRRRISLLEAIDKPSAPIDEPQVFMAAIADLPPADRRTIALQLLPRLAISVAASPSTAIPRHLRVLLELACQTRSDSAGILRIFAKSALAHGNLLSDPTVASQTIAYAFGATDCQPEGASERDHLVDLGVELASLYSRAGGGPLNRYVDEQASQWPEPARSLFRLARQRRPVSGWIRSRVSRLRATIKDC